MGCSRFQKYTGQTKSDVIAQMIQWKRKEEFEKQLPEISKNSELLKAQTEYVELKKRTQVAKKALDKKCLALGVSYSEYGYDENAKYKFVTDYNKCFLTQREKDLLQQATNFSALQDKKQAKKIWDKLIAENELTGA